MKTMSDTEPQVTRAHNQLTGHAATGDLPPNPPPGRLLGLRRVLELVPVGKTTWYKGIKAGVYPAGRQMSDGRGGWTEASIRGLIEGLPEAGRRV